MLTCDKNPDTTFLDPDPDTFQNLKVTSLVKNCW